nr:MAG TPA: hypothetical protein [Caudoviricetes sp.]
MVATYFLWFFIVLSVSTKTVIRLSTIFSCSSSEVSIVVVCIK